ncbi:unnamed protein product [Phyllotreta striolata]|uniref:Uncharacterized protein n=1 Tax=Phyllotreta striolata TaxID=444603 RepID=A0A9N9T9W7_PHYSR|nr:unnamed protein product [Phyllotreta striolata]
MAAFKLTFFLCAAFLIFQANALPQAQYEDVESTSVIDLIKKLVKRIEGTLDWVVAEGEDVIAAITPEKWDEVQKKTVDVTTKVLSAVMKRITDDVSKFGDNTPEGKKLAGCIVSSGSAMVSVPVTFYDDASKCLKTDLLALVKALGPVIKDLASVQVDAKKAADGIDKCSGDSVQGLLCVVGVAGDVLKVVGEIPAKVQTDIAPLEAAAKAALNSLSSCVKSEIPVYFKNAGTVLDSVAACATLSVGKSNYGTDLVDIIQKIVQVAEKVVDNFIEVLNTLIIEVKKNFSNAQTEVLKLVDKVATREMDKFNKIIIDVSKQSDVDGQDLIKCIASEEHESIIVAKNLVESITTCARNDLVAFLIRLHPLITDLSIVQNLAKTELANLSNCEGSDTKAVLCVLNVATNVIDIISQQVPKISQDVQPVLDNWPILKSAVVSCWKNTTKPGVISDAANVINKIAACDKQN